MLTKALTALRLPSLPPVLFCGLFLTLTAAPAPPPPGGESALWGRAGERWTPKSRLPDFSYAGYRRGERSIPQREATANVAEFGARGDDDADDTESIRRAIEARGGEVIDIPAGRYVIRGFVDIRRSGTVLRGAPGGGTVLWCPTPLNDIEPNWGATTSGQRTSNYSWSGGFLRIRGGLSRDVVAGVTESAERGDTALVVSSIEEVEAGDELRLEMRDTGEQTLARHLYAGDSGPIDNLGDRSRERFAFRVTAVDARSRRIEIDRPLRTDVHAEWRPTLYRGTSSVEECGIERLVFEFPVTPYGGHFTEVGYNAIAIGNARHCWVRDVVIRNADSGIFVSGQNITLQGVVIESTRATERQRHATGHHGITLGGQDNLLLDFDLRTRFMHDVTLTRGSAGNVVTEGRGVDLSLDHHRYGPHSNLFTDIDLGEGSRMYQSGGGAKLGWHCAAYGTFWGIRAQRKLSWPPRGWGPDRLNLIGISSDDPAVTDEGGRWFEPIPPSELSPQNLYRAQLERRLGTAGPTWLDEKKLTDPSRIIGATHAAGTYSLSDDVPYLEAGARRILELESKVIKLYFYNPPARSASPLAYPFHSEWPRSETLVDLARTEYFRRVFEMPFETYVLTVFSSGRPEHYWRQGVTAEQAADETRQFYELTKHLLTTYAGVDKTFILSHWEGDWALRGSFDGNANPGDKEIQGMIDWLAARQLGVRRARADAGRTRARVFHAAEVNRVQDCRIRGVNGVTNRVLPHVAVDLVSYSAYDTQRDPAELRKALDYIAQHAIDRPPFGSKNVYLGEIGHPENERTREAVVRDLESTLDVALEWGCPYILYWQVFCNEATRRPVSRNDDVRGFWLVRPDGSRSWAWDVLRARIAGVQEDE